MDHVTSCDAAFRGWDLLVLLSWVLLSPALLTRLLGRGIYLPRREHSLDDTRPQTAPSAGG